MSDIVVDGKIRVAFVPTIADPAAPTTTEITAGIDLQSIITADGLIGFEPDTAEVDASSLDSDFDYKQPGRAAFSGTTLRIKKQSGTTDEAYETLTRGTIGFIVIRRYVDSATAWAAADKVGVYPIACGETKELPPEANTMARYEVPVMVTQKPALRAVIAT